MTESGFRCYLTKYHRELVLARYAILCSKEEAGQIKLGQLRGQLPATRVKYKDTCLLYTSITAQAEDFIMRNTPLAVPEWPVYAMPTVKRNKRRNLSKRNEI